MQVGSVRAHKCLPCPVLPNLSPSCVPRFQTSLLSSLLSFLRTWVGTLSHRYWQDLPYLTCIFGLTTTNLWWIGWLAALYGDYEN